MSTNTKSPKRTEQGVTFGLHFSFLSSDRRRGEDSADSSISEPFKDFSIQSPNYNCDTISMFWYYIRLKFKP